MLLTSVISAISMRDMRGDYFCVRAPADVLERLGSDSFVAFPTRQSV
jgi:hypothetical protein